MEGICELDECWTDQKLVWISDWILLSVAGSIGKTRIGLMYMQLEINGLALPHIYIWIGRKTCLI